MVKMNEYAAIEGGRDLCQLIERQKSCYEDKISGEVTVLVIR
jgi:hypothetical protein